jgi:DNA-binding transcriptional regulator YbjK
MHIVRAAERAFVRFGFHATTMQNVAEEAGMSAGKNSASSIRLSGPNSSLR